MALLGFDLPPLYPFAPSRSERTQVLPSLIFLLCLFKVVPSHPRIILGRTRLHQHALPVFNENDQVDEQGMVSKRKVGRLRFRT